MPNRKPAAGSTSTPAGSEQRVAEALELMTEALQLIDENDGPHDAGAHLDSAIDRLRKWLAEKGPDTLR